MIESRTRPATEIPRPSPRGAGRRELLEFLAVLGAVAAVHFFRDPASFLLPPLSYEDGRDFFAFFYNHRQPGAILRFYAGYVSLLPNLVGYAAMALPTSWTPRALAWIPGILTSLACALPFLTFRGWMRSPVWRAGTCFTLALLPVANRLFLSSTAYSIWPVLLILVWGSLARPPASTGTALPRGAAMATLICSHPLSIALVPVYAFQAWRGWTERQRQPGDMPGKEAPGKTSWLRVLYPAALIAVVGLYAVLGIEPGGVETPAILPALGLTAMLVLERVVFATVFGDAALLTLRAAGGVAWIYLGALAILAAGIWVLVRYRRQTRTAGWWRLAALGWLVVAFTGLYVISRSPSVEILGTGAALRYFWVQRLLFAAALAALAQTLWTGRMEGGTEGKGRMTVRRFPVPVALWILFLGLALLNLANGSSYRSPRRQGHQMAAFVRQVQEKEATAGERVTATLPRRSPWSVELRPAGEDGGEDSRTPAPMP